MIPGGGAQWTPGHVMQALEADCPAARGLEDRAAARGAGVGWRNHKHGVHAVTEACGEDRHVHRGRVVRHERRWCPVAIRATAAQIAAARRGYLDWWGALPHLQAELRGIGLQRHVLTDAMPPLAPWSEDEEAAF